MINSLFYRVIMTCQWNRKIDLQSSATVHAIVIKKKDGQETYMASWKQQNIGFQI